MAGYEYTYNMESYIEYGSTMYCIWFYMISFNFTAVYAFNNYYFIFMYFNSYFSDILYNI